MSSSCVTVSLLLACLLGQAMSAEVQRSGEESLAVPAEIPATESTQTETPASPGRPGDAGEKLRILRVSRSLTDDQRSFNFSVEYWAPEKPEIEWNLNNYTDGELRVVKDQDFVVAEKGRYEEVKTWISNEDNHFFYLEWRQDGDEDRLVHEVHIPASNYTPGTNLTYAKGQATEVEIRQRLPSGAGVTFMPSPFITGKVLDPNTGYVKNSYALPQHTYLEEEHVDVVKISFPTDITRFNGFYVYHSAGFIEESSRSPIISIWENARLLVHEDTNQGPFPNDALFFMFDISCSHADIASHCEIRCFGYANDPGLYLVEIVKMEGNGSKTPVKTEVQWDMSEFAVFTSVMLKEEEIGGEVTCRGIDLSTGLVIGEAESKSLEEEGEKMRNKKRKPGKKAGKKGGSTRTSSAGSDGINRGNQPPQEQPKSNKAPSPNAEPKEAPRPPKVEPPQEPPKPPPKKQRSRRRSRGSRTRRRG